MTSSSLLLFLAFLSFAQGEHCANTACFAACEPGTCSPRPNGQCCDDLGQCSPGGCCGDPCGHAGDAPCKEGPCGACVNGRCGSDDVDCSGVECGTCPFGTCPGPRKPGKCCDNFGDCSRRHCFTDRECERNTDCREGEICDTESRLCFINNRPTGDTTTTVRPPICILGCPDECRPGECAARDPAGCCPFTCSNANCASTRCRSDRQCPAGSTCDLATRTCRTGPNCDLVDCFFPRCPSGTCSFTLPGQCCPQCLAEACGGKKCVFDRDCGDGGRCDHELGLCSSGPDCSRVRCPPIRCAPDACSHIPKGECCPTCTREPSICNPDAAEKCSKDLDCGSDVLRRGCNLVTGLCVDRAQICPAVLCPKPRCPPGTCSYQAPDECCPKCVEQRVCDQQRWCFQDSECGPGRFCDQNFCADREPDCSLIFCDVPFCQPGECVKTAPGACCPGCSTTDCGPTRICETDAHCDQGERCNAVSRFCEAPLCPAVPCARPFCQDGECLTTLPGQCCPTCAPCSPQPCSRDADCGLLQTCNPLTNSCESQPDNCAAVSCVRPECDNGEVLHTPEGECCPICKQGCRVVRCGPPRCKATECQFQDPSKCCLECGTGDVCPTCRNNGDCPTGESCNRVTGRCRKRNRCARNRDCPDGMRCRNGRCRNGPTSGGKNAWCSGVECQEGQVCVRGKCSVDCRLVRCPQVCPPGQCPSWLPGDQCCPHCSRQACEDLRDCDRYDLCPQGTVCKGSDCVPVLMPPPDVCYGDEECPSGLVCDYGVCRPSDPVNCVGAVCPEECPEGQCGRTVKGECCQVCSEEACTTDGCISNEECPEGEECNDGECEPSCADAECPEECPEGQCGGTVEGECCQVCSEEACTTDGCISNEECPEGEECNDGECEPSCANAECPEECPEGQCGRIVRGECCQVCSEEACTTDGCISDPECPEGEQCENGVCNKICIDVDCPEECPAGQCGRTVRGECCQVCSEEACTTDGCISNEECPIGKQCNDGKCQPDCSGVTCTVTDCPEGQCDGRMEGECCPNCSEEACPPSMCTGDEDCPDNQTCNEGGICELDCSSVTCTITECPEGQCDGRMEGDCCPNCSEEACPPPMCTGDEDCPDNQTCNEGGICELDCSGVTCTITDCPEGQCDGRMEGDCCPNCSEEACSMEEKDEDGGCEGECAEGEVCMEGACRPDCSAVSCPASCPRGQCGRDVPGQCCQECSRANCAETAEEIVSFPTGK